MTMVQEMKLTSSEELQSKWKTSIQVTCYVYRSTSYIRDIIDRLLDAINLFLERLKNLFSPFVDSLKEAFQSLADLAENRLVSPKRKYPQYIKKNFVRLNTVGYRRPIIRCARSRC